MVVSEVTSAIVLSLFVVSGLATRPIYFLYLFPIKPYFCLSRLNIRILGSVTKPVWSVATMCMSWANIHTMNVLTRYGQSNNFPIWFFTTNFDYDDKTIPELQYFINVIRGKSFICRFNGAGKHKRIFARINPWFTQELASWLYTIASNGKDHIEVGEGLPQALKRSFTSIRNRNIRVPWGHGGEVYQLSPSRVF